MNPPIHEQDEFLLSRLLDDDLSPEESASLRARMEREPELRRAYAAMTRIESLLTARRADQPQVDWSRFHSRVMSQVEAEAAHPATIKLANYLRAALPLAAAAAIALAVWFWPHNRPGPIKPIGQGPIPTGMAVAMSVVYDRPESAGANGKIRVSFARSDDEVTRVCQADDETSRSRESSQTSFLVKEKPPARTSSPGLLAEALPLFE
jgi:hypothetical protein